MTNTEFVRRAIAIVTYRTLYVNGCFGSPMTEANKIRYSNNTSYNKKAERRSKILSASSDTFGFDCVGLIKGILWNWRGTGDTYGGAIYCSNHVPDISEDKMIQLCRTSQDWDAIKKGCVVWMKGHIGIYVGDGLVVESSPAYKDGVQYTACGNIGKKAGYPTRTWTKWGELPYILYEDEEMVSEIEVLYNGQKVKVSAINKDGTNYIKLRDLDTLGIAKISYDNVKKLPIIEK